MGYWVGLDVGTTFSAAAVASGDRVEVVGLGLHTAAVPSVLFLREDGAFLVGDAAARRGLAEPGRVARYFKRRFGDSTPLLLGGSPFSADALVAQMVRFLVEQVTAQEGEPPVGVAVTHPANWGPFKTDLLAQAVRSAGVEHAVLLSEPEAAALQYAWRERVEAGQVVGIYDLGGGTFDAAVLAKSASGFELLGDPEGIERLGGIDFDEAVLGHVQEFLGSTWGELDASDPATLTALARLRADCVDAKEALSADTDVSIPVMLPQMQTEIRLTRAEFESMIRPTLAETIAALSRAFRSAGVSADAVKAVLLVGGSSRIPLVGQMVAAEVGRPVAVDVHPKHVVALGAALAAAGWNGEPGSAGITGPGGGAVEAVAAAGGAGAAAPAAGWAAGGTAATAAAGVAGGTAATAAGATGPQAASAAALAAAAPAASGGAAAAAAAAPVSEAGLSGAAAHDAPRGGGPAAGLGVTRDGGAAAGGATGVEGTGSPTAATRSPAGAAFRSSGRAPQPGGPPRPPDERAGPGPSGPAPSGRAPSGPAPAKRRRSAVIAAAAVVVVVAAAAAAVLLVTRNGGSKGSPVAATTASTEPATTTTSVLTSGTLSVPGTQAWTDTHIDVDYGQHVRITATGMVQHNSSDPNSKVGPDGDARLDLRQFNVLVNGTPLVANHAALIAKIGDGDPFVIGAAHDFDVNARGRLFLGVNDLGVENNLGSFQASITVTTS